MRKQLYINDRLLDLDESVVIAFNYQVNDIAELEHRQAHYSNRFKIPATNNNIVNLGLGNEVNSLTPIPYRKSACNYFQNGVQLIQNGVLIVDGFDGQSFDITIYSGIFDFFQQLEGKTLRDIDWSELNHFYSTGVLRDLARNYFRDSNDSLRSNSCFPLIDYGVKAGPRYISAFGATLQDTIDIRYQQPVVRKSYILDKIFELTNYNATGEILEDDIFNELALTINVPEQTDDDEVLLARSFRSTIANRLAIFDNNYSYRVNLLFYFRNFTIASTAGLFLYEASNPGFVRKADIYNGGGQELNNTRYRSNSYTTIDIDVNLHFDYGEFYRVSDIDYAGNAYLSYVVIITLNGRLYRFLNIDGPPDQSTFDFSGQVSLNLKPGDEVGVLFDGVNFGINFKNTPFGIDPDKTYISFTATNTASVGTMLNYNALMPEIPLKDFIKGICNMFALVVSAKDEDIIFTKFNEITDGVETSLQGGQIVTTPKYEDWSDKLDLSFNQRLEYRIGAYGQENHLRYANDANTNGYGDGVFEINDEVLQRNTLMFELPWSSALPTNVLSPRTIFKPLPIEGYESVQQWSNLVSYPSGSTVKLNNLIFVSNATTAVNEWPFVSSKWDIRSDQFTVSAVEGVTIPRYTLYEADAWDFEQEYSVGDEVVYNGVVYVSNSTNTNSPPPDNISNSKWEIRPNQYEQTLEANTSVVLVNKMNLGGGVTYYTDGISASTLAISDLPIAYFARANSSYALTFQYLITNYYSGIIRMLTNAKILTCGMMLTENDINNINFLESKYIKYYNEFFYLNVIKEYIEGQTSECQLIRL